MAVSSRIFVSMSTFVVVVSGLTCALWFISNRPLFKKRRVLDQINQLIAVFSGILVVFVIANFSVLFWGFSLAEGLIANNMLGDCCQNPNALVQLMHWVLGYPVITLGIVIFGLLFRRQQLHR